MNLPPLLAPLLKQRVLSLALLLSGLGLLCFQAFGASVWHCPFKLNTGLPCPGCGFTRGTLALLQGDWRQALAHHPFTPLVLPAFLLLSLAALSPERWRERFIPAIERLERRTGISHFFVSAFLAFGFWRMLAAQG